jgi:hypothetical protein
VDNKEIDDMFFKIYGQEKLTEECKNIARNSNAYVGFKLYIKLERFIRRNFYYIQNLIKK